MSNVFSISLRDLFVALLVHVDPEIQAVSRKTMMCINKEVESGNKYVPFILFLTGTLYQTMLSNT